MKYQNIKGFLVAVALTISLTQSASAHPFTGLEEKSWTGHIGFGSSRLNNIVGLTKDFPLDDNWRWHLGVGLGDILIGGGVGWYQNYHSEGMVFTFNAGLIGAHANFCYQFEVGAQSLLTVGAGIGSEGWIGKSIGPIFPIVAYEYKF